MIFTNTRISPLLWPLLRRDKVTIVVHDLMDTSQEGSYSMGQLSFLRWFKVTANTFLIKQSVKRAGRIVSNSAYTRYRLAEWLGNSCPEVHVLHPPPSFRAVDGIRALQVVDRFDDSDERTVNVLAVAGVTTNKSLSDYFIWHKEVSRLARRRVWLKLYGVQFRDLSVGQREYVKEMGGLISLRYRQSESLLLQDYLTCDFLVSLSSEEGFGIPVADAIGFGIKVIARKIWAYEEQRSSIVRDSDLRLGKDVGECSMMTLDLMRDMKSFEPTYFIAEQRLRRYKGYVERHRERTRTVVKRIWGGDIDR